MVCEKRDFPSSLQRETSANAGTSFSQFYSKRPHKGSVPEAETFRAFALRHVQHAGISVALAAPCHAAMRELAVRTLGLSAKKMLA
jgi:hypothetical protein